MTAEFPAGTVAVATVGDVEGVRVFRLPPLTKDGNHWAASVLVNGSRLHKAEDVTDVRPLVVLDLDTEQDKRMLAGAMRRVGGALARYAEQVEEQTRPPKPPEPTGLGAVVEDTRGRRFTRYDLHDPQPWWWDAHGMDAPVERRRAWSDIDVARVLSTGVDQ